MLASRLKWALPLYALLAIAAGLTLDGNFRLIVLLFLGVLAFRSWLAVKRESLEEPSARD